MAERPMTMAPPPTPRSIADELAVPARVLLFCLASGTDQAKAGVKSASVQLAIVRGLATRDASTARLTLTALGHEVLAELLEGQGGTRQAS